MDYALFTSTLSPFMTSFISSSCFVNLILLSLFEEKTKRHCWQLSCKMSSYVLCRQWELRWTFFSVINGDNRTVADKLNLYITACAVKPHSGQLSCQFCLHRTYLQQVISWLLNKVLYILSCLLLPLMPLTFPLIKTSADSPSLSVL